MNTFWFGFFSMITLLPLGMAVGFFLWRRRLLLRIQTMIDAAVAGTFTEQRFNESRLSALENSLWRYLQDNQVSRQRLLEQKQNIQEGISDISHQAVTPLSNILLYSELLEELLTNMGKDDLEELAAIREQAEKLDFFMQALQKLSRLEYGILSLQPEEQDISEVLLALRRQYLPSAAQKQIQLLLEPTSGLAIFDRKWTIEAIGNLIDNAIKYTPEGGTVSVCINEYLLFLRIDIRDTGIGISEQELGSIFTRFYRSANVKVEPGIGLGLYLTREVMKAQNGYLKVSSVPGTGSIFSVFLLRKSPSEKLSQN